MAAPRADSRCLSASGSVQYPGSLIGETCLEALLLDLGFGPDERLGGFVVGRNEGIDMLPELFDGAERCAAQGLALQDREPDFHLVEPRGPALE